MTTSGSSLASPPAQTTASPQPAPQHAPAVSTSPSAVASVSQDSDEQRLAEFWKQRTRNNDLSDYPLGAGDVLIVSVPGMEEIHNREVRISGAGTIALPLVGRIQAEGLTEEDLREEIRQHLEANYMYNPQVNVFVREYRSRQVAVLGAVDRPGLYRLASEEDTLLDMLSMAGGLSDDAAQRIHFIPAEPVERGKAKQLASALPSQLLKQDASPVLLKKSDPLVIDLRDLTQRSHQLYLAMPARPGDVLLVPGGGEVLVDGWIKNPGSYKISPGLTVLGAVAAAGGPLFAADEGGVRVMRANATGEKTILVANLDAIKHGTQQDIPILEGDIIEVTASTARLVPYGVYQFFSSVFRVGGTLPLSGF